MQFVYSVRHTVPVQSLYGSCTVPASARRIRQAQGRAGKKRKSKGKKRSTKKPGRNRTAGHRSLVSPPPTHPLPASRFLGLLCSPPSFPSSLLFFTFHLFLAFSSLLHHLILFSCISSPVQPFHSSLPASPPLYLGGVSLTAGLIIVQRQLQLSLSPLSLFILFSLFSFFSCLLILFSSSSASKNNAPVDI